jgi:RimJ/RimL family protein N-acetyltransferase
MNVNWQPLLENDLLILRPLKAEDFDTLFKVASDPLIWEQHPAKIRSTKEGFELFFNEGLAANTAFTVIDKKSGDVIGSTRFNPVVESTNAIEIGWTFLGRQYWGTAYNKSMKALMMDYAFRFVDNVFFYIHEDNHRSQKAVEKLGGVRITQWDGVTLSTRPTANVIYRVRRQKSTSPSIPPVPPAT